MNILVTSAGRRVKIIEYFREALHSKEGKVIATDCDSHAPAIYFADDYEIVPRIDSPDYIEVLIKLCEKHNIRAIVSLIDPELELLAKHKKQFDKNGVTLVLSPLESVEMTFDKYETYNHLNNKGIPAVPTYNRLDEVQGLMKENKLSFPLVVKPAKGSASIDLYIVHSQNELIEAFNKLEGQIIQPFYKDKEFGIDVYIDMISGELVDSFIKEKIRMRAGETDKSKSIHNEKIQQLVNQTIKNTNFLGPIDIDCFEHQGEYYISEINPRFGGGYPHAHELGCDFMKYIVNNLQNESNETYSSNKYDANLVMMKYDNVKIVQD